MAKENIKLNRIEQASEDIKKDIREHKPQFIACVIGIALLSIVIASALTQYYKVLFNINGDYYLAGFFTECFKSPISLFLMLLIAFVLARASYKMYKVTKKEYEVYDEDGDSYKRALDNPYGGAEWMGEEERKATFQREKDFYKITGDIIGRDKDGYIYSIKDPDLPNQNKIIFGSAGSGKSVSIVYNDIISAILQGRSIIATDSKGDVYANTVQIAKNHGYIVRVLNLRAEANELKNSDAWEPMKYITKKNTIQAEVLANAIIENTLDGARKDYWAINEMNCLKATLLLVATSDAYEGRRTMGEVVDIVTDPTTFDSKFAGLDHSNPARAAFDIYMAAEAKVRGQILNGMANRLGLLTDPYLKEIVSHDEIDLILPMKKPCIYYIIISDSDTTLRFVASMFFTQIFTAQLTYSDKLTAEQKKKQVSVRYELDEFKNIGTIPDFDVKIAVFRSRKITSTIILQNLSQLKEMYPHGKHNAILSNTSIHICLRLFDEETAKYFEFMCGTTTILVESSKYVKGRSQMVDLHDGEGKSAGLGKRPLLMADSAMRLGPEIMVVVMPGHQPIKLMKYRTYLYNPVYKEEFVERKAGRHKPKWRRALEEKQKRLEEAYGQRSEEETTVESAPAEDDRQPTTTSDFEDTPYTGPDESEMEMAEAQISSVQDTGTPDFDSLPKFEYTEPLRPEKKKKKEKPKPQTRLEEVTEGATKGARLMDDLL